MNKFKKSTILIASLLSMFGLNTYSISANNNIDSYNFYDDVPSAHQSPLGAAQYFHIFSKNANLNAHTNGNVATNKLNGSVNFGTNIHEGLVPVDINYIKDFSTISPSSFVIKSNTRTNKVVFGPSVTVKDKDMNNTPRVSVNDINLDHLSSEEVYSDNQNNYLNIEKELNKVNTQAQSWIRHVDSGTNTDYSDFNNRHVTISDKSNENIAYLSISTSELAKNTPIKIYGTSDVSPFLIINVIDDLKDSSNTVTMNSKIEYYFNGQIRNNHESEYFADSKLLINFASIEGKDININSPFQGTIVAPQDNIIANQNIDGSLIAETVTVNAETHRWDPNLKDVTPDTKEPDTKEPDTKEPDTKEPDTKEPDTKDPDTKEPDTKDLVELPNTGVDKTESVTIAGVIMLIMTIILGVLFTSKKHKND